MTMPVSIIDYACAVQDQRNASSQTIAASIAIAVIKTHKGISEEQRSNLLADLKAALYAQEE